MKILVTGGNGQLAWDIKRQSMNFPALQLTVLDREQLDITNRYSMVLALDHYNPALVINTAAFTAVDKAEQQPDQALAINSEAAGLLAQCCVVKQIPLVHCSTDYVFDGKGQRDYREEDAPNPLNVYGDSKLRGEELVRYYCAQHIILRVSGVFGMHGNNFVKAILHLAKEKEELRVIADQITCPTPAADITAVIFRLITQLTDNCWGTYHYCASKPISWYEFAQSIIQQAQQYTQLLQVQRIVPIKSEEYHSKVQRPAYSVLNCDKIARQFNIEQKSWEVGLKKVIEELLTEE